LSLKELCLVEPLTIGFHAVERGRVEAGDTVAIFGCGGVGLGAIAASASRGATTIAIDIDYGKLATASEAGAAHVIHADQQRLSQVLSDLTGGSGPDVVIEAIGTPETFRAAVELVAYAGRVVYIGYAKQPVSYETQIFVRKELDILGSRNALPMDFENVIRMLEQHRFPVQSAVSTEVPLTSAPATLAAWNASPAAYGKIMIRLD
jgi:threonine dehydrogenase-like Zn-dependent dehydrogenase